VYIGPLQITKTIPANNAANILTYRPVLIYFSSYIDVNTLDMGILVTTSIGTHVDHTVTLNREEKCLEIIPISKAWDSNTTYFITVVGQNDMSDLAQNCIKDVSGAPLFGSMKLTFTTIIIELLKAPVIISPIDKTIYLSMPGFSWESVSENPHQIYEVMISYSNTFEPLIWSNDKIESTGPISPNIEFSDGIIYWRVRAIDGQWSDIQQFNLSIYGKATISEEDTLSYDAGTYDFSSNDEEYTEVLDTYPERDFSNVSTYLKVITLQVTGTVLVDDIDPESFIIKGEAVDGDDVNDHGYITPEKIEALPQPDGTTLVVFTLPDLPVVK